MVEQGTGAEGRQRTMHSRWWFPALGARVVRADEPRLFRGIFYGLVLSAAIVAMAVIGAWAWFH